MKKDTVSQFCTCILINLASFLVIFGTNTFGLTQTARESFIKPPSSSTYIWPAQGILSQRFNKNRHIGIDIAGPPGTPIVAAASGQVVKAEWDDWGLGNAVTIQHPDQSITVYGHNRRFLVKKGQQVSQGQVIAEMGNTGNSSGPHLHFEIHPRPRAVVDPMPVLPPLIAGKIPPLQTATTARTRVNAPRPTTEVTTPSDEQPQAIPIAIEPVNLDAKCNGKTMIEGETTDVRVKVCQENNQFFYIGQLKQHPTQPVRLPALNVGEARYQANNGSFSYIVSPVGVEVWRNGRQIRSDSFHS
ncbi:M23 family metallopeptidase [Iningainema tapete]|uniref:M23 family metallopeptidase n=1 Tax=Iningainema tapete BLCC-T55 TaxID=2748662 RepID=A0A8J6XCX2_9CYAN|nr:M23 family metallopeptidase [Iningainema tapete]MBD2772764.1 M23 family metallopeptidase [Iningainema tapete BLCC-T55]